MPMYSVSRERFAFTVDKPVLPAIHRQCGEPTLYALADGRWACDDCGEVGYLIAVQ